MSAQPDLVYYPDTRPGIRRKRAGRGFSYIAPDGTRIDNSDERRRLAALAVPPAYEDVWICPLPRGHLQATGRDTRARKQYRYHEDWTAYRADKKYSDLPEFGAALPSIRRRIAADLRGEAGERDFAIAAVLAMIDRLAMRVGNRDYAAENGTYGVTTLRRKHLRLANDALELRYIGKGNKPTRRTLRDKKLAKVLHALHDLPGGTLVSWLDEDGEPHEITSCNVNERLAEITGRAGFTAKTFRTWAGTTAALDLAMRCEDLTIKAMSDVAAERLGNTPTIARNSYIHPEVIALSDTEFDARAALRDRAPEIRGLRVPERALLGLLGG